MKDIKNILIEKAKKVFEDVGDNDYFENTFKVFSLDENKKFYKESSKEIDFWTVFVSAPDKQWGGSDGFLYLEFKNSDLEPYKYHDGAAEGRTPDFKISKKDNKYFLDGIYEDN